MLQIVFQNNVNKVDKYFSVLWAIETVLKIYPMPKPQNTHLCHTFRPHGSATVPLGHVTATTSDQATLPLDPAAMLRYR